MKVKCFYHSEYDNTCDECKIAGLKNQLSAQRKELAAVRRVVYYAWSLRNQFNGEWDTVYFPALATALDKLISGHKFPAMWLPKNPWLVRKAK